MLPRHFITKDGRRALVRRPRIEDAHACHECNRAVISAGVGMTRSIEELDALTDEQIISRTRDFIDGPHSGHKGCMLIAEIESLPGIVAGAGVIRRPAQKRMRHTAHVGIGIAPEYQELGLGRALMLGLIEWARALPGRPVTRIDLNVISDNLRAIRLYESLGFEHEGRRRRMVRYEDGSYADDLTMGLLLE